MVGMYCGILLIVVSKHMDHKQSYEFLGFQFGPKLIYMGKETTLTLLG